MAVQLEKENSNAGSGLSNAPVLSISPEVQLKLVVKMFLDNPSDPDLQTEINKWLASNKKVFSGEAVGRTVVGQMKEIAEIVHIGDRGAHGGEVMFRLGYAKMERLREAFKFAPELVGSGLVTDFGQKNFPFPELVSDASAILAVKEERNQANTKLANEAVIEKLGKLAKSFVTKAISDSQDLLNSDILTKVDPFSLLKFTNNNETYTNSFINSVSNEFSRIARLDPAAKAAVLMVGALEKTFGPDAKVATGIKTVLKDIVSARHSEILQELNSGKFIGGVKMTDKDRVRYAAFLDSERAAVQRLSLP